MKRLTFLFLCLTTLTACFNDADSKEAYTVEDAKKDGHVITEHLVDNFEQITQGAVDNQNVDKILSFLESVDQKEKDSVDISIFTKNGTHFNNTISYDGDSIVFENNFDGYFKTPVGKYSCEFISKRGPIVYLDGCKAEDGTKHSSMIGFIGTKEAFNNVK